MRTRLVWCTPNAEQLVVDMARVSNPAKQGEEGEGLLKYLIRNRHWSPFEMVSACFEIETTRDIARQILRHRSFSFQEFSQRYANWEDIDAEMEYREARGQDFKNRQNSIPIEDIDLREQWNSLQYEVKEAAMTAYSQAIELGIAKEVARVVLPEGMTPSRMYMSGTIRSWLHYLDLRCGNGTQKEHIEVAQSIKEQLNIEIPAIMEML